MRSRAERLSLESSIENSIGKCFIEMSIEISPCFTMFHVEKARTKQILRLSASEASDHPDPSENGNELGEQVPGDGP